MGMWMLVGMWGGLVLVDAEACFLLDGFLGGIGSAAYSTRKMYIYISVDSCEDLLDIVRCLI